MDYPQPAARGRPAERRRAPRGMAEPVRKRLAAATVDGYLGPPRRPQTGPHVDNSSAGIHRGLPKTVLRALLQRRVASAVPPQMFAG